MKEASSKRKKTHGKDNVRRDAKSWRRELQLDGEAVWKEKGSQWRGIWTGKRETIQASFKKEKWSAQPLKTSTGGPPRSSLSTTILDEDRRTLGERGKVVNWVIKTVFGKKKKKKTQSLEKGQKKEECQKDYQRPDQTSDWGGWSRSKHHEKQIKK